MIKSSCSLILFALCSVAGLLGTAFVVISASAALGPADAGVVHTDGGWVRGTVHADYRTFEGIPYAAAPVGRLRFGSPQPPARWSGMRRATRVGPACAQAGGFPGDRPSSSENCLYLNVTTPRHTARPRVPVMVWIHGDGFFQSSGGIYGAERLATEGKVVVVTFNYRLGALGFLAHPALDHGPADHLSGNFGLEDQQAALRWVRRNAARFGGDPHNVTIFGESAGAMSVCAHLAAPGSAGLFQRAIIQSGPCTLRWPYPPTWGPLPRSERNRLGIALAGRLGCGDLATAAHCLRALPVAKLVDLGGTDFGPGPTVGGGVLPTSPARAIAHGWIPSVPVMQGTTRDEHITFVAALEAMTGQPVTPGNYAEQLRSLFDRDDAARVLARYPLTAEAPAATLAHVLTDYSWACPAAGTDRMLARHVPTYAYEFADRHAPWFRDAAIPRYRTGAYHASELQYLFSGAYSRDDLSPAQQQLSRAMIKYWTHFAYTGNPNGPTTDAWPRFAENRVQSLAPGRTMHQVDLAAGHQCGFWASIK